MEDIKKAENRKEEMNKLASEEKYAHTGMMKITKVRNRAAAAVQITAEQILAEAHAHREEVRLPKQVITDQEEFEDYKLRMRTDYENKVRRQRSLIGNWLKYARWEENLGDFARSRSVYERSLEVDYRNVAIYLKYAEMEMRNKFINHARNVWERACRTLPTVEQFWYKYAYMEELLGNYTNARDIYSKWMTWKPSKNAWYTFLKFEQRMGELERCRKILNDFINAYPEVESYIKAAKFEDALHNRDAARSYFEKAISELGEDVLTEPFFLKFTRFEIKAKETERARALFKHGIANIPKEKCKKLYESYLEFEKQFGTKNEIEMAILTKRRLYYEGEVNSNPQSYDDWIDYIRLEESAHDLPKIREVYERAIAQIPPIKEKKYWRRYIYIWIFYQIFEEISAKDIERAEQTYSKLLDIIPHQTFTFSKIWVSYAHFLIRNKQLDKARKVLGKSIGLCPREKIISEYIDIELQLGEIDRCRLLCQKLIEKFPKSSKSWIKFTTIEKSLYENDRVTAIFEIGIEQPIDYPEHLWKAYIEYENENGNIENASKLYDRLLAKSKHPKVWISYALFLASVKDMVGARRSIENAYNFFKESKQDEERCIILDEWIKLEQKYGDKEGLDKAKTKLPKKVKKRRKIEGTDDSGFEEYIGYMFPDDDIDKSKLKILERAMEWKKSAQSVS